jgi:hypothetical protein
MRTLHKTLASLGILAAAGTMHLTGCSNDAADCTLTYEPCDGRDGGGTSGGREPPPGCEKSPKEDPDVIKDECGVFVSASAPAGGNGKKDSPFNTLQAGIEKANGTTYRVYACAETYAEEANLDSVSLFGGFDCAAGWSYVGGSDKRATIAPADGLPLRVSGGVKLMVQDVVAQGPDYAGAAAEPLTPGKSSIAAIVSDESSVAFSRCLFDARNGQNGAPGESLGSDQMLGGADGLAGLAACKGDLFNGAPGGAATTKACDGVTAVGGKGGDGGLLQAGSPPVPLAAGDGDSGPPAGTGGQAGIGEPSGSEMCSAGQPGASGAPGDPGTGAMSIGSLAANGYVPASGSAGTKGKPGQGGGGGGGAKGGATICPGSNSGTGASGGSGGSGGCGGKGGGGGLGGGASIALVSLNATVTLMDCELNAANGGNGGAGGVGQYGGAGGISGPAGKGTGGMSKNACAGGDGGSGGDGGPGGGGAGGPSIGIAHVGTPPELGANVMITEGIGGLGGKDGAGGSANKGADGKGGKVVKY